MAVGEAEFVARLAIIQEPGRGTSFVDLAPRLMMHIEDISLTRVIQPGSRIFVTELEGSGQWEISDPRQTFRNPKWSADGRYLFFVSTNGEIFRHRVSLNPTFVPIGQPEVIARFPGSLPDIAVHPDGKRLLVSSSLAVRFRISRFRE